MPSHHAIVHAVQSDVQVTMIGPSRYHVRDTTTCLTVKLMTSRDLAENKSSRTNTHQLTSAPPRPRTCNQHMTIDGSAKTTMAPAGQFFSGSLDMNATRESPDHKRKDHHQDVE
jgi:hypothetical protein